jgi:NitT/TauT family transport system substrate-binding protein
LSPEQEEAEMKRRSLGRVAAVLAALAVLVAGATSTATARPTAKKDLTHVNVADLPLWLAAADWLALDKGFYEKQGLDVHINTIASPTLALAGLASGSYDIFGTCGITSAASAHLGGVPLKFIAPAAGTAPGLQGVVVAKDSPIKSRRDLAGKTIGLTSVGGSAQEVDSLWLSQGGVDPTKVSYVPLPSANIATAIQQGRIDAGQVPEPFLSQALATGQFRKLGDDSVSNGPYGTITAGFCASNDFIDKNPAAVKGFVKAILAANKYVSTHKAEAKKEMTKYAGLTADQAAAAHIGAYPQVLGVKSMQKQIDAAARFGILKQRFDVKDMIWSGAPTINK